MNFPNSTDHIPNSRLEKDGSGAFVSERKKVSATTTFQAEVRAVNRGHKKARG